MNYLILPISPSGGGKTFLRQRLLENNPSMDYVSPDEIRKRLYGDESIQGNPKDVFRIAHEELKNKLAETDVYFDATNIDSFSRFPLEAIAKQCGVKIIYLNLTSSIASCKFRNTTRQRSVPDYVIDKQFSKKTFPVEAVDVEALFASSLTTHDRRNIKYENFVSNIRDYIMFRELEKQGCLNISLDIKRRSSKH